jgi:hypothetical protein
MWPQHHISKQIRIVQIGRIALFIYPIHSHMVSTTGCGVAIHRGGCQILAFRANHRCGRDSERYSEAFAGKEELTRSRHVGYMLDIPSPQFPMGRV